MKIMITGPQGCGKTTQARKLADKLQLPMIGVGDLLRALSTEDSEQGRHIKEALDKGALADDGLVAALVKDKIQSPDFQNGFVTDGYPRTMSQHLLFDPGFDKVFYLDISGDEVTKRLLLRGRADDTPDKIEKRLAWYRTETQPLLDLYRTNGTLVVINGEQSVERIAAEIASHLTGDL